MTRVAHTKPNSNLVQEILQLINGIESLEMKEKVGKVSNNEI